MADDYTSGLRLRRIETGSHEDEWGDLLNTTVGLVDDAISGMTQADVTSGNVTLVFADGSTDEARMMFVLVSGSPSAARQVTLQNAEKVYVVINTTDVNVTLSRASGGTTLVLSPQQNAMVYLSASGVFEVGLDGDFVQDAQNLTRLSSVPIVGAGGGGQTAIMIDYIVQGRFAFVNIANFSASGFVASTLEIGPPTGGSWPAAIVPALAKEFPVTMILATPGPVTTAPGYLRIPTSASASWEIVRADGAAFSDSLRAVAHHMSILYSLVA